MNGVLESSLALVCGGQLLLSTHVMAEEVNSSATQPAIETPVRIDESHPPIVSAGDYPLESARAGEKGYSAVRMEVDFDGLIRSKQLVVSTGFRRLDAACLAAFSRARFIPATLNGKPVANWINMPIEWGEGWHLGKAVTDSQLAVAFIQKDCYVPI